MKNYAMKNISEKKLEKLFKRPELKNEKLSLVQNIVSDIKKNGLKAALKYAQKYDGFSGGNIKVSEKEIENSEKLLDGGSKSAIQTAFRNIKKFHLRQFPLNYEMETGKDIFCSREFRPIENVGLYIPGGTAALPSTLLMLGIPARIAGCKRIVAITPVKNKLNSALLYAAKLCGINEIYKIGGAHGVALLAYGDKKIKKIDKIFGPGNQYVTAAKSLVSIDAGGCAIDMPAGPSELLVIADESANPEYVAADLLSQAEHGADSQVILLSTSEQIIKEVNRQIKIQKKRMPRENIIDQSLKNSFSLLVESVSDAIRLSNRYAPEHLILNVKNYRKYRNQIINAGSVFFGPYSPESLGDYASGTNHSLPTYGYAKVYGGISVESFMKSITFQSAGVKGFKKLAPAVIKLAEIEKLDAHANAIKVRMKDEY